MTFSESIATYYSFSRRSATPHLYNNVTNLSNKLKS